MHPARHAQWQVRRWVLLPPSTVAINPPQTTTMAAASTATNPPTHRITRYSNITGDDFRYDSDHKHIHTNTHVV